MAAIKLGIDAKPTQNYLNQLSRATTTRIRRCIAVKRVALEKIREDTQESREYGFKHLNRIIELQIISYPRYAINIQRFLTLVKSAGEKISLLQPLDRGFLKGFLFKGDKNNLEFDIALTEEKFASIREKAGTIYEMVTAQRKLLKLSMTGDEEAELRRLLAVEFEKSEELIKELNSCMEIIFRAIQAMSVFQIRFIKFLKRCKTHKFSNIIDDSQVFCDKVEKHISTFYAFKTYIQVAGFSLYLFAPYKEIKTFGLVMAGGILGLDTLVDFISGLPAQRRIVIKASARIRAVAYEEEENQKQLTARILAEVQRVPSGIPNI